MILFKKKYSQLKERIRKKRLINQRNWDRLDSSISLSDNFDEVSKKESKRNSWE